MARPIKKGLDYFPQDTDIYSDRKTKRLIHTYGANGFLVYDYIKSQCFKENGYWILFDENFCFDIIDVLRIGINEKQIMEVITTCISMGLFDEGVFNALGILTSADIQATYLEAKKSTQIIDEIWVIPYKNRVTTSITPVNDSKTPENEPLSTQRKGKEIKVKESIGNERKEKESNFFNVDDVKENYASIEDLKNAIISDERYLALICGKGVRKELIGGWLDAFNRLLTFRNIHYKAEGDYRSHFASWLIKIPGFTTMHPGSYSPIKEPDKPPAAPLNAIYEKIKRLMGK